MVNVFPGSELSAASAGSPSTLFARSRLRRLGHRTCLAGNHPFCGT